MTSKKESTVLNKITGFCKNNGKIIFLGIFLLLNCFVFFNGYSDKSNDSQQLLLLSYQNIGFSSRIFLGTILRLLGFSNGYLNRLIILLRIIYVAVSVMFFWFVAKTMQNDKNHRNNIKKEKNIELWCAYICACPIFLYGFSYNLYGSTNIFLVLLMLISFLLLQNQKATFLIPILCVLAILTDHVFSFIYLPVLCLLLWHKSKSQNRKPFSMLLKSTILFSIFATIIMICFSFKSEFPTYYYNLKMFSVNNFHFLQDLTQNCGENKLSFDDEIIWLLIALPLIVFFAYLWRNCLKASKGQNVKFYKLCFIHLALCLPSIVYFKGFRSWLTSVLVSQTLLVLGLLWQNNKPVEKAFEKINLTSEKSLIILVGFVFAFYFLISVFLPDVSVG